MAAYSASDFSASQLPVLILYGSEDEVLNKEKLSANEKNLPESEVMEVIDGGNHAQFGTYGPQSGDGYAVISGSDQLEITAGLMKSFIQSSKE